MLTSLNIYITVLKAKFVVIEVQCQLEERGARHFPRPSQLRPGGTDVTGV